MSFLNLTPPETLHLNSVWRQHPADPLTCWWFTQPSSLNSSLNIILSSAHPHTHSPLLNFLGNTGFERKMLNIYVFQMNSTRVLCMHCCTKIQQYMCLLWSNTFDLLCPFSKHLTDSSIILLDEPDIRSLNWHLCGFLYYLCSKLY